MTSSIITSRRRSAAMLALLGAVCTAAGANACANVSEPPGGPPDAQAPRVVRITPDTNSIAPRAREVRVQFDEVIAETPRGQQDLSSLVFISPKSGSPRVEWDRSSITIRPQRGFRPNTVYAVTISPGIVDLRNNGLDSTIQLVFSTGPEIPKTRITGAAFEWAAGKGAPKALVEAIAPDSTTYQILSDSAGRYELRSLPPGPYVIRAILDRNNNRELDPLEPWDTSSVNLVQTTSADLYAFQHDTAALRITDVALVDSNRTLKLTVDRPYLPEEFYPTDRVIVQTLDSMRFLVTRVVSGGQRLVFDSLRAAAREDSIARAKGDTGAVFRARADSAALRRRQDSIANAARALRERQRQAAQRGERLPLPDTVPLPRFQRPRVFTDFYITLGQPLPPATRVRVTLLTFRNLSGQPRNISREFLTPRAAPDSVRR